MRTGDDHSSRPAEHPASRIFPLVEPGRKELPCKGLDLGWYDTIGRIQSFAPSFLSLACSRQAKLMCNSGDERPQRIPSEFLNMNQASLNVDLRIELDRYQTSAHKDQIGFL